MSLGHSEFSPPCTCGSPLVCVRLIVEATEEVARPTLMMAVRHGWWRGFNRGLFVGGGLVLATDLVWRVVSALARGPL